MCVRVRAENGDGGDVGGGYGYESQYEHRLKGHTIQTEIFREKEKKSWDSVNINTFSMSFCYLGNITEVKRERERETFSFSPFLSYWHTSCVGRAMWDINCKSHTALISLLLITCTVVARPGGNLALSHDTLEVSRRLTLFLTSLPLPHLFRTLQPSCLYCDILIPLN